MKLFIAIAKAAMQARPGLVLLPSPKNSRIKRWQRPGPNKVVPTASGVWDSSTDSFKAKKKKLPTTQAEAEASLRAGVDEAMRSLKHRLKVEGVTDTGRYRRIISGARVWADASATLAGQFDDVDALTAPYRGLFTLAVAKTAFDRLNAAAAKNGFTGDKFDAIEQLTDAVTAGQRAASERFDQWMRDRRGPDGKIREDAPPPPERDPKIEAMQRDINDAVGRGGARELAVTIAVFQSMRRAGKKVEGWADAAARQMLQSFDAWMRTPGGDSYSSMANPVFAATWGHLWDAFATDESAKAYMASLGELLGGGLVPESKKFAPGAAPPSSTLFEALLGAKTVEEMSGQFWGQNDKSGLIDDPKTMRAKLSALAMRSRSFLDYKAALPSEMADDDSADRLMYAHRDLMRLRAGAPGFHWGTASQSNEVPKAVAFVSGTAYRPLPTLTPQPMSEYDSEMVMSGWRWRTYAQRRVEQTPRSEWPAVYRGMMLPVAVLKRLEAERGGKYMPLTGATAFSFDPDVAEHYSKSSWVRSHASEYNDDDVAIHPVVLTIARDDRFDGSVSFWHEREPGKKIEDHEVIGPAYEVVSGAPGLQIEEIKAPVLKLNSWRVRFEFPADLPMPKTYTVHPSSPIEIPWEPEGTPLRVTAPDASHLDAIAADMSRMFRHQVYRDSYKEYDPGVISFSRQGQQLVVHYKGKTAPVAIASSTPMYDMGEPTWRIKARVVR